MVVGDRLWLFSQPPHGPPAPIQSLLLNNIPAAPQHMSSVHPSVLTRAYAPPAGVSPLAQRPNQGYNMSQSTSPSGFMNKQMRFEYLNKLQFSPYNRAPSEAVDFRFAHKPILKSSEPQSDELLNEPNSCDLANLESRFGNNSSILSDNNKFQEAISVADDTRSSSGSEIDCEEIE